MAKVSVIVIVLDGQEFVAEAIDSVVAQQGIDWELLVVDDGSSDRTVEIVSGYVRREPDRIRLLHHPERRNRGMSASRNLGVRHATGDYVAFLDADDLFMPGKLAEQAAILDAEPGIAMVHGRTLLWYSWLSGNPLPDRFHDLVVAPDRTHAPPTLFRLLITNVGQSPTTCNAMIRRAMLLDVDGFDERFRGMFEDRVFFAKLMLRYPTHVSSRCWAKYRRHETSVTSGHRGTNAGDRIHLRHLAAIFAWELRHRDASLRDYACLARMGMRVARRMARRSGRQWGERLSALAERGGSLPADSSSP